MKHLSNLWLYILEFKKIQDAVSFRGYHPDYKRHHDDAFTAKPSLANPSASLLPTQILKQTHHPPPQLPQLSLRNRPLPLPPRLPIPIPLPLPRHQPLHDAKKRHLKLPQLLHRRSRHLLARFMHLPIIHLQLLLLGQLVLRRRRRVDGPAQRVQDAVQLLPPFFPAR